MLLASEVLPQLVKNACNSRRAQAWPRRCGASPRKYMSEAEDASPTYFPGTPGSYARHGLYVTTLEEIEVFQYIRTPNIGRGHVTAHDARFAIAWRGGVAELDFGRSCFLSWNDRFYKPEEAVIIIQATIRSGGQPPLRILRFNGDVCAFSDSSAAAIMSGLLDIFRRDLVHAKRGERESVPTIHVRSGLHISEGLASVSSRQLNEMLANTRFHRHIYDGSVQSKFNRAFPRGRERYSPAERLGRARQQSVPEREPSASGWYSSARHSAPPAPRTYEQASGSGIARPVTPPKTPPKTPPRDPTTYLSEQEFANLRDAATPAPAVPRGRAQGLPSSDPTARQSSPARWLLQG